MHNWGIIGPGKIAHKFALALQAVEASRIAAVASRSIERASSFAKEFDIPKVYDHYDQLLEDPEIEIIYIATPHPFHFPTAQKALQKGKHVCCEKPLGMNAKEVKTLIDTAAQHECFLMEALWTHFLPSHVQMRQWIREGMIGEVLRVSANFGFRLPFNPDHRVYNPSLGGSGLLDVGIYPLYLCQAILGKPSHILAQADFAPTGVDQQCQALLSYSSGAKAQMHCAANVETNCEAWIEGTEGAFRIARRWHEPPAQLSLFRKGQLEQDFDIPMSSNGMEYQIRAVQEALSRQQLVADWKPEDSLLLAQTMDTILNQVHAEK